MPDQILDALARIENKLDIQNKILERIELNQEKSYNDILGIMKIIHKIMLDILTNLTEESGGDLVAALRKLTEVINSLCSEVSAVPSVTAGKIKTVLSENGSAH